MCVYVCCQMYSSYIYIADLLLFKHMLTLLLPIIATIIAINLSAYISAHTYIHILSTPVAATL